MSGKGNGPLWPQSRHGGTAIFPGQFFTQAEACGYKNLNCGKIE